MIKRIFYSCVQKLIEWQLNKQEDDAFILMFHQIDDDITKWDDSHYSITVKSFISLIEALSSDERSFINLGSLDKCCSGSIALTFDDAYSEVFERVYYILRDKGIPFAIFMTYNFIGKEKYLTRLMLQELVNDELCTIGSHSMTHPLFRFISKEQVISELVESRRKLAEEFNTQIEIFAFPYGSVYSFSRQNVRMAMEAGYKMVFTTLACSLNDTSKRNLYCLPRINVCEENWTSVLQRIRGSSNAKD